MDRKLMEEICKEILLDLVMDSEYIKEQLSFNEQVGLCSWIKELSYEEVVPIIHELGVRDFESKFSKFIKYGMAAIAGGGIALAVGTTALVLLGAPAIGAFTLYLFRKSTDPCHQRCKGQKLPQTEKRLCKLDCKIKGVRIILRDIKSEHAKCIKTAKPDNCERGLTLQEIKWEKKLQEYTTEWQQLKEELAAEERARAEKEKAKEAAG